MYTRMLPLNLEVFVERQELFIVISLGEIVAAASAHEASATHENHDELTNEPHEDDDARTWSRMICVLIVLMAAFIKLRHFDCSEHPVPTGTGSESSHKHALSCSHERGILWVLLHIPLNAAIVLVGSIAEPLKVEGTFDQKASWFLGGSIGTIILVLALIDVLHSGGGEHLRLVSKEIRTCVRIVFIGTIAIFTASKNWGDEPVAFMCFMSAILACDVLFTYFSYRPKKNKTEASHEELSEVAL